MEMKEFKIKESIIVYCGFLILMSVFLVGLLLCHANETTYYPVTEAYEGDENSNHEIDTSYKVDVFDYGNTSIGKMSVTGDVVSETTYNGVPAYSVNGALTFGYSYDGSLKKGDATEWKLFDDKGKSVAGEPFQKKISKGAILIQKSIDMASWETVGDQYLDFFDKNKSGKSDLYITSEEDLKVGVYYRVIVAYELKRKIGEKDDFWHTDIWEYKKCTEVYTFFACIDNNYVEIKDLDNRSVLQNGDKVKEGFYLDMNESDPHVFIKKDDGHYIVAEEGSYRCDKGKYEIHVRTKLGSDYYYSIEVTKGASLTELNPKLYESRDNSGYTEETLVNNTAYGGSYTNLYIGTDYGYETTKAAINGSEAYGVAGNSVGIFLKLNYPNDSLTDDWELSSDTWGKNDKENVYGINVGEVKSGAVIVQHSMDGTNWSNVNLGQYTDGLYSTDFASYFDKNDRILLYTPSGSMVLKGMYIRVIFAYETYQRSTKSYKNYIEKYEFYLCSSELDAVTFHNLTTRYAVEHMDVGEENENSIDIFKMTETLTSGALTTKGFEIDTELNPTVSYEVYFNGSKIAKTQNGQYTESGKYEIELTSATGDKKNVVIYVDTSTKEEALERYFKCTQDVLERYPDYPDNNTFFIYGKRIFGEGEYPIYEAGHVAYHVENVDSQHLPVHGYIKNLDTQSLVQIRDSRVVKNGELNAAGNYEVVLTTKPDSGDFSGDCYTFTFHFRLIPEGSAPGPRVNQNNLKESSQKTMCDSYPVYYGRTVESASKGSITLAFCDYEAAYNFSLNYENGMVQDNNYYRGKEYSDSEIWELNDDIRQNAKDAVKKLYFDMTDSSKYATLEENVIDNEENLRTLELPSDVIVFGDKNQKTLLIEKADTLPCLNAKPYEFIDPYKDEDNVDIGVEGFTFIKDKYGCDSHNVWIIDYNGKIYDIEYGKPVYRQLEEYDCPTGIVTINETTIYGDSVSYNAVYFSASDNTADVELRCYSEGDEKIINVTQDNCDLLRLEADAFKISGFHDELDPYSLIVINRPDGEQEFFAGDDIPDDMWIDSGKYDIRVVNRIGNEFDFSVEVVGENYSKISFSGPETEELSSIITNYGAQKIILPELQRENYIFDGYTDEDGNHYRGSIEEIDFKGTKILTAEWILEKCTIILLADEDTEYGRYVVEYGEVFELPIPDVAEGMEFVTWLSNGQSVGNSIVADKEEIVLLMQTENALINNSEDSENEDGDAEEQFENESTPDSEISDEFITRKIIIYSLGCVVLLVILLIVIII